MVKVCIEAYPLLSEKELKQKYTKGYSEDKRREPGFYMHDNLKKQLDYYLLNVVDDWDFTILICGEGEVRVGKSVLAMEIAAYWVSELKRRYNIVVPFNVNENFVFNGRDLIKKGNTLGQKAKYAPLIFDEAGADLEGAKAMRFTTQAVKDYLRECGQYNMLNILVLPEYFDLPKGIAISRSSCLINVYYIPDEDGYFKRGYFKYYSRPQKKYLYILGKRYLDYSAAKEDFYGDFDKFYPIDELEYRAEKRRALKNREMLSMRELRRKETLKAALKLLHEGGKLIYDEIANKINAISPMRISTMYISRLISGGGTGDDEDDD